MRPLSLFVLSFDISQLVIGLPILLTERTEKRPGYFKLSAEKKSGSNFKNSKAGNEPRLVKRSNGLLEYQLENQDTFYSVEMSIGSDGQTVNLLVDTGSSDMWVVGSDNQWCESASSEKVIVVSSDNKGCSKKRIIPSIEISVSDELDKRDSQATDETHFQDSNDNAKYISEVAADDSNTEASSVHGAAVVTVTATAVKVHTTTVTNMATATTKSAFTTVANTVAGTVSRSAASSMDSLQATYDCAKFGTYNSDSSSSWNSNNTDFSIKYMDGTYAKGTWGQDKVTVNGATISNMNFATANDATSEMGVLGIGYQYLESTYTYNSGNSATLYDNLPMKLKLEGFIDKITYSIYLNDSESSTANVLFGGIDHDKYTGDLTSLSVINPDGNSRPDHVMVTLNSLSISTSSNKSTIGSGVGQAVLDTGSTLSYFPTDILQSLLVKLNSQISLTQSNGYYMMRCSEASDYSLNFNFQGYQVKAPLTSFLLGVDELSNVKADQKTSSYCAIGILETDSYFLLGDVFLRNIYMVVDLEDDLVAIAPANTASRSEKIEAINSSIPSATAAATTGIWTKGSSFTAVYS